MNRSASFRITMKLLSDTIFGSGNSIPGGEDIAVYTDGDGYPCLKGSTLKGLLRESLENWIAWTDDDPAALSDILGEGGRTGVPGSRRIRLTGLTLADKPADPESCFMLRSFTALENGTAKDGSLRTASCIRSGLVFSGELSCAEEDAERLQNAFACIRWVGTMRSRGFGRVKVSLDPQRKKEAEASVIPAAACLRLSVRTEAPVQMTYLSSSRENSFRTKNYLTGSALRGMVMGRLAEEDPVWFEENKKDLLSGKTRFLDLLPTADGQVPLPAIRGFYEEKDGSGFESVAVNGSFSAGKKRAKLGSFCAPAGDTLLTWSSETGNVTRIRRPKSGSDQKQMFETQVLREGQNFTGYIMLDRPEFAEKISSVLRGDIWLGADQYEGFGKCSITELCAVSRPDFYEKYGISETERPSEELYLLALSPLTMLDEKGDPCGLDCGRLAKRLGVTRVSLIACSTGVTDTEGYNRTWKSRIPIVRMYDRGSLFHLRCEPAPSPENLRALEKAGIGPRREEGFGQILFLPPRLVEGLHGRKFIERPASAAQLRAAALRRSRYRWVMSQKDALLRCGVSSSQLGDLQSVCERSVLHGRGLSAIRAHLTQRCEVGAQRSRSGFQKLSLLLLPVLEQPLGTTLGLPNAPDSLAERISLLCLLFDFSRKQENGGERK